MSLHRELPIRLATAVEESPDLPTRPALGASGRWQQVLQGLAQFAPTPLPVLLLGPTGAGKTTLAAEIHRLSGRRGPFVSRHLPAIPLALRQSMFEGHQRGAFTGAVADHAGLLEQAHQGTLFLDEIGLIPAALQELLLSILDGRGVTRIGDVRPKQVDVRFLFATNADPRALVAAGRWQPAFYYRLGFNWIAVPGLADRREDIIPLALRLLSEALARVGKDFPPRLSPALERLFERHPWPGNIRELKSVCLYAAAIAEDRPLEPGDLPAVFLEEGEAGAPGSPTSFVHDIHAALRRYGGNKSAAARALGISRQRVHRFLERCGREADDREAPEEE